MTNPTLTVEIGHLTGWTLGVVGKSELGQTTNLASLTYDNITSKVRSLSIRRGRNHELDRVEAGTASVRLLNQDGAFNPTNTSSTYYPNIRPMIPIRIRAEFSAISTINDLVAWFDFADAKTLFTDTARTTPVSADGNTIKGVTDKSGSGNHLSEATNGPAYKISIQNALSVSRFDGTNDLLAATITATAASTIWLVLKSASAPSGTQKRAFTRSAGAADLITLSTTHGSNWVWVHNNAAANQEMGMAVDSPNFHIVSLTVSSASSFVPRRDGVTGTTFDPRDDITTGTNFTLGNSSGEPWDGDIAETALFSRALTIAEHNIIGQDLAAKWGLTWTTAT